MKSAVETLSTFLAKELRRRHYRQYDRPGPTATNLFTTGKSPELIERTAKIAPLERLGTPENIVRGWLSGRVRWRLDDWPDPAGQCGVIQAQDMAARVWVPRRHVSSISPLPLIPEMPPPKLTPT